MEKAMSLISCLDEDGNIDPLKYRELRKFGDACDDEDQVADSDDDHGNNRTGKKRKFLKGSYEGYDPQAALGSEWYLRYMKNPRHRQNRKHFKTFRRRFRMPFEAYLDLLKEARENDWFPNCEKCNALGQKCVPLEILILGALRYLGRGWTFDDLFESTGVSEVVHRVFFKAFVKACRIHLYPKWVKRPETSEEIEDCMSEFKEAGFDGCIGSVDVTHIILEKCHSRLKNQNTGSKDSHTTRAFQIVVNHRRQIIASTVDYPGRWNDKTVVRLDGFVNDIQRGLYLKNNKFTLLDGEGNVKNYTGAWILVDGVYLNWSTLICPFKETISIKEQRWSRWAESMRIDVECTFGILKGERLFFVITFT
jgi:Plant transposon protein